MKRTLAFLAFVFLTANVFAQVANSDQILKKTDGGIVGDSSKNLAIGVKVSGTAPSSPVTGQQWCDTATSPCTLKVYNGSTWQQANTVSNFTTQADLSTFPSSPSDGQNFFDKSHNWIWVYNSTLSLWCNPFGSCTSASITDNFTGSTITNPAATVTLADGGASGNMTTGTHVCAITFATSTGGETTAGSSASSAVSITASHKITVSSIPTGGSGTTQRRIYCSKAGTTTPRFWVATLNDNSSTTITDSGIADGSMKITEPDTNYSAPLNARWTFTNLTAQTTSGGCGSTGSSVICHTSHAGTAQANTAVSDPWLGIGTSISAYNSGNYTIQYRIVRDGSGWAGNVTWPTGAGGTGGLSAGTSYAAGPIEFQMYLGSSSVGPPSGTNVWTPAYCLRTAVGIACGNNNGLSPFPRISSFPFWVRIVKNGNVHTAYYSKDFLNWTPLISTGGASSNPADSALGLVPSSLYDTFNWWMVANGSSAVEEVKEMDSFTLTVN